MTVSLCGNTKYKDMVGQSWGQFTALNFTNWYKNQNGSTVLCLAECHLQILQGRRRYTYSHPLLARERCTNQRAAKTAVRAQGRAAPAHLPSSHSTLSVVSLLLNNKLLSIQSNFYICSHSVGSPNIYSVNKVFAET